MTTLTLPAVGLVDIYPVGLLRDLRDLRFSLTHAAAGQSRRRDHIAYRWRSFRRSWRRQSYWNGYLAEPRDAPFMWHRCGHGWTQGRALRDLHRHLVAVATDNREATR